MLSKAAFKSSDGEGNDLRVCMHPESGTLMMWIGNSLTTPCCALTGEELGKFQRWLTDPEYKAV